MAQPVLLTISSPSGAGKSTLCQKLLADFPTFRFSVSTTTRSKREGEVDGIHYHFVKAEQFKAMVDAGEFVEWEEVHGHRYGTTHQEITSKPATGIEGGILFDVDYRGSQQIKAAYPETLTVFILPPSMEELERRIRGRGTDAEAQIALRMGNARHEMEHFRQFEYIVINDDVDRAYERLRSIVLAEGCRRRWQEPAALRLLES